MEGELVAAVALGAEGVVRGQVGLLGGVEGGEGGGEEEGAVDDGV